MEAVSRCLRELLLKHKNKRITLNELQAAMPGDVEYIEFAHGVIQLQEQNSLNPIKSAGDNGRKPPLSNAYHIMGSSLKLDLKEMLHQKQYALDAKISLENYYRLSTDLYLKDLPYIERINAYIQNFGFPIGPIYIQKLSFDLVGDEKWLYEKDGLKVLRRLKIEKYFQPAFLYEPLAFAINSKQLNTKKQNHLIIENKAPFLDLMEGMKEASFATLIYGCGWQVVSSLAHFNEQVPINAADCFYYFGDLDREGIHIYYCLKKQFGVQLAVAYYMELLQMKPSRGKENQRVHQESMDDFVANFEVEQQEVIQQALGSGYYFPQELLNQKKLHKVMMEQKD